MSSRRSSFASHHAELRKGSTKDPRGSLSALTASARAKVMNSSKQPAPSADSPRREKRSSTISTSNTPPKRPGSTTTTTTTQRNQSERNSAKNRHLLDDGAEDDDGDGGDKKGHTETTQQDTSLWKELVHIKDRLEKLEVADDGAGGASSSSTTTTSTTLGTPITPPPPRRLTVHQKRLQDALVVYEQSQPPVMTRAMSVVVAEAINMNQQLWQSIPRDLDAKALVTLQKSSDAQLKALTETLLQLCRQSRQPLPPPSVVGITPRSLLLPQQQKARMPPVSEYGTSGSRHHHRRSFNVGELVDYSDFKSTGPHTTANARYFEPRYSNFLYDG